MCERNSDLWEIMRDCSTYLAEEGKSKVLLWKYSWNFYYCYALDSVWEMGEERCGGEINDG